MVYMHLLNASKHPGHIVLTTQQPRRSAAEMAEACRLEAELKQAAMNKKEAHLCDIATLENVMALQDEQARSKHSCSPLAYGPPNPYSPAHLGFGIAPTQAKDTFLGRANIVDTSKLTNGAAEGKTQTKLAHKGALNAPMPKVPTAKVPSAKSSPSTIDKKSVQPKAMHAAINAYCKDVEANAENKPVTSVIKSGKRKSCGSTDDLPKTKVYAPHFFLSSPCTYLSYCSTKKAKPAKPSGLLASWTQPTNSVAITAATQRRKSNLANDVIQPGPTGAPVPTMDVHDYAGYISSDEDENDEVECQSVPDDTCDRETADVSMPLPVMWLSVLTRIHAGLQGIMVVHCEEPTAMIAAELLHAVQQVILVAHGTGTNDGLNGET